MRRFTAAAVLCLALAAFHTWPLASAPHRLSLNYNADAQLTAWIVSWIAYALPHEPQRLFAGNIFQPDDRALAYSEPLFVPALIGAPIRWSGGSAVLTNNVLLILGLALTALASWWVVDRWTGSFAGGIVAGALTSFNAHLLSRLPHMQAAHAWGLPLAVFFADRIVACGARVQPSASSESVPTAHRRSVAALAVVLAATAVTSVYTFVFTAAAVAVVVAVTALDVRSMRGVPRVVAAGLLAGVLALPILLPYARLAREGARRPIEQVAELSATPRGYLVSLSRIDGVWGRKLYRRDIDVFFPGAVACLLAIAGAVAAVRDGGSTRRRAIAVAAIGIVGFILSLGPATPLYVWAYRVFLPLQGIRVAARFGLLLLLAIALLAGFAVAALQRRVESRALRLLIGALLIAAVTGEAWHGPVPTTPFTGVPRIYARLDAEPRPALLAEAPFWVPQVLYMNGEYVLNATEHRTPTMNGYSGVTPASYRRLAQWFWFFPEQWAIDAMRHEGVTHVMVHLEQFGPDAEAVKRDLAKQHDLELIAEDPRGHRLYRFVPKAEPRRLP